MGKYILFLAALLSSIAALAQQPTPAPQPDTKNVVVEKDGKLYVQSTTVTTVETTADAVAQKIEQLQQERDKVAAQADKIGASIAELQRLFYDLQKREKKRQKDDAKGSN